MIRWKRLFAVSGCLTLLIGAWLGWRIVRVTVHISDAYAQWGAAEMVLDFMRKHDGNWPRSWEDLRPSFEASGGRVRGWSFAEFRDRIWIDFNASPESLSLAPNRSGAPSFDVIHPTDATRVQIQGMDANNIVLRYLREKRANYDREKRANELTRPQPARL